MFRQIRQEEENTVQALTNLMHALQAHKTSAERERDKFDKNITEQRSAAIFQTQNLDFDKDFGNYKTHSQSIKLCREAINGIDGNLKMMITSFNNTHYRIISQTSGLMEHGQATRQQSMSIVIHLDRTMRDPGIFHVYEVYDMLGNLVTYLENWCFVINQMIEGFNDANQSFGM